MSLVHKRREQRGQLSAKALHLERLLAPVRKDLHVAHARSNKIDQLEKQRKIQVRVAPVRLEVTRVVQVLLEAPAPAVLARQKALLLLIAVQIVALQKVVVADIKIYNPVIEHFDHRIFSTFA